MFSFRRSSNGSGLYIASSAFKSGARAFSRSAVCRAISPESARRYWSRSLSPSLTLKRSPDILSYVSSISLEDISSNFFLSNIPISGPDEVSEHVSRSLQVHSWLLTTMCILYGFNVYKLFYGPCTVTRIRNKSRYYKR